MFEEFVAVIVGKGQWLGLLMVIDVVLGVAIALKNKEFEWQKLSKFLVDYGLRTMGWVFAEAIALMPETIIKLQPGFAPLIGDGIFIVVMTFPASSILKSMKEIGILPEFLQKVGV